MILERRRALAFAVGVLVGCGGEDSPAVTGPAPFDVVQLKTGAGVVGACAPVVGSAPDFGLLDGAQTIPQPMRRAVCPAALGKGGITWGGPDGRASSSFDVGDALTQTDASGALAWSLPMTRNTVILGAAPDDDNDLGFALLVPSDGEAAFAGHDFELAQYIAKVDVGGALRWSVQMKGGVNLALAVAPDGRVLAVVRAAAHAKVAGVDVPTGTIAVALAKDGSVLATTLLDPDFNGPPVRAATADAKGWSSVKQVDGHPSVERHRWDGSVSFELITAGVLVGTAGARDGTTSIAVILDDDLQIFSFDTEGRSTRSADLGSAVPFLAHVDDDGRSAIKEISLGVLEGGQLVVPFGDPDGGGALEDFSFRVVP